MEQKWLKFDLHTHSDYSRIRKPRDRVKQMSADEYVNTLKNAGVDVFSITDHNYFSKDYYDSVNNYIINNSIEMKVINGIELDCYLDDRKDTNYFHTCFYFEDKVDKDKLEKSINEIYDENNKMHGKPTFSEIIAEFYKLNSKFIIVPHGDKSRGLFEFIKDDTFQQSDDFYKYAMYKIIGAFDVKASFKDNSYDHWAGNFFNRTKHFNEYIKDKENDEITKIKKEITKKLKNKKYELSEELNTIYECIIFYGGIFSFFSFSDWHNAELYDPKINNYIFGRLDLAFESFEMAVLDPISRSIISSDREPIKIMDSILKEVHFKIGKTEKSIYFTPGLNAIIGKRGSGKSLLISTLLNLNDKNNEEGAIKKYSNLNISDIEGYDRAGIKIRPGELNSITILNQDSINKIYEDPEIAENGINEKFKEIDQLDLSEINEIIGFLKPLQPYNQNYKVINSDIVPNKELKYYNYIESNGINVNKIEKLFDDLFFKEIEIKNEITNDGLNTERIEKLIEKSKEVKEHYISIAKNYKSIIDNYNNRIAQINRNSSESKTLYNQKRESIKNALAIFQNNLNIKLNFEKLLYCLEHFKMDNSSVAINKHGNYLFATYYVIPDDIKEKISEKVVDNIKKINEIKEIKKYLEGNEENGLKSKTKIEGSLDKYIREDDTFKIKKAFYRINDNSIDYESLIKNYKDLEKMCNEGKIIDLSKQSLGQKSVYYLDMLFNLNENILVFDQPEDNIDNDYISNNLVPLIKNNKKTKQLIFVTHNPSVAIYGDAFNYIFVNNEDEIEYSNLMIEKQEDKDNLIRILEGGKYSFANRNKKYGNVIGEEEYYESN